MERGIRERASGWAPIAFFGLLFIGLAVFFLIAHPLYLFDTDDWWYAGQARSAIPIWGIHNPTRVLPEILMPFATDLAVYLLFPLTGDYVGSVAILYGLLLAACITGYFAFWYALLRTRLGEQNRSLLFTALAVLVHFWMLNTQKTGNLHAFSANDVTCVFYYVIPSLLASSLVLWLFVREKTLCVRNVGRDALLIVAIYLAVFSNLFQSAIVACYALEKVISHGIHCPRSQRSRLLQEDWAYWLILVLFVLSMVYEKNGNRAHQIEAAGSGLQIKQTARHLLGMLPTVNKVYLATSMAVLIVAAGCALLSGTEAEARGHLCAMRAFFFCLLCVGSFVFLLCAKVGAGYIAHTRVLFGAIFYYNVMVMLSLAYLTRRFPRLLLFLPLALVLLFNEAVSDDRNFAEYNVNNYPARVCRAITNDVIRQVQEADAAGGDVAQVCVPAYGGSNWPFGLYGKRYMPHTMYKHGLTSKRMVIDLIPDREMNDRYGL